MSSFPGSPNLARGALVGYDPMNPLASVIVFQYNPQTLTRSLRARSSGGEGGAVAEVTRLSGAPEETISLEIEIDATDQLEKADPIAVSMGIYPQLSALEMLLYPKTVQVIANTALMAAGTIEIIPPEGPFVLFIWGMKRVLPVKLSEFSITEEAHDVNLNPIRAKISLSLKVLSYNDLSLTHPGYYAFLGHQAVKEAMAVIGSVSNVSAAASSGINLG
ncbi:MAG: hypothetical protein PHV74_07835 [Dehalococcoidia bacterium]|nr:hypothetical protein [Dehalococcoidia bacterium]